MALIAGAKYACGMPAIPDSMRAIEIDHPGGPEVLRLGMRPTPRPGPTEVLIRVAAAGVNYPDTVQRRGFYAPPPGTTDIPGLEVAGTIVEVGSALTGVKPGDAVCALLAGGGYAEYCVVPFAQVLPMPAGMDFVTAAAIPETFFTVWVNVFERGKLRAGEAFLVHGGTSGIGTTAIQLAKAIGARVFATAGTAEKCRACEALGAERAVNYREEDFVAVLKQQTDKRGVDVILDMVGGDYLPRNLALLAEHGRLVEIGAQQSREAKIDIWPIMQKRLTITGSLLRPRSPEEKGIIAQALYTHVWPLLESGAVRPVIHETFPLAQAAEAHRLLETSTHVGKIVLVTN